MRTIPTLMMILALAGCNEAGQAIEPAIRGLETHPIADVERTTVRRFPSVLEPTSLNTLSFEVAGKLNTVTLEVGQRVEQGQTLLTLDAASFQLQLDNAEAEIVAARAARDNTVDNFERQEQLFERGIITRVARDAAETEAIAAETRLEQAINARDSARETLSQTSIVSPIDGIINAVDAVSFGTVSPGVPMVSVYSIDAFEVSFSVNFDTVSQLVVGTPATVRLADLPSVVLNAVVSELGSRADTVSSFPVVLRLEETDPVLKAGMAVEASIELPILADSGFPIPLSALIKSGQIGVQPDHPQGPGSAQVYVYDDETGTVMERDVTIAGVRENGVIVIDGLAVGDRIASAGVSFLRDGMQVNLLADGE